MNPARFWRGAHAANPFAANTAVTAAANVVIAVFGMASGIVAARLLGPHGRGELAAIQTIPSFIATLAMFGLPDALTYYSAQSREYAGQYLGTASVLALAGSVPLMIAGYLAMPALLHAQNSEVIAAARWYLLIAPIWALQGMLPPVLRGNGHFTVWNVMRLMVAVCTIAVLWTAWLAHCATARVIAFGNLGFNALLFAPFFWLVCRRISGSYSPERNRVRPLLQYGLPCAMTGLPQMLNLRLDQILMAAIVAPRDLGLYVVAVAWSGAVSPVLSSVGASILPSVVSAESSELAVARLGRGVRAACVLAVLVCGAAVMVTPVAVVFLFGSTYRAAIPAALVLVPAAGMLGVNLTLQESIRGLGFPYTVLRAELFGLAVTGLSLAVMLQSLGILGAAISSLLGYSAVTAALVASAMRLANTSARELLVPSADEVKMGLRRIGAMARNLVAA